MTVVDLTLSPTGSTRKHIDQGSQAEDVVVLSSDSETEATERQIPRPINQRNSATACKPEKLPPSACSPLANKPATSTDSFLAFLEEDHIQAGSGVDTAVQSIGTSSKEARLPLKESSGRENNYPNSGLASLEQKLNVKGERHSRTLTAGETSELPLGDDDCLYETRTTHEALAIASPPPLADRLKGSHKPKGAAPRRGAGVRQRPRLKSMLSTDEDIELPDIASQSDALNMLPFKETSEQQQESWQEDGSDLEPSHQPSAAEASYQPSASLALDDDDVGEVGNRGGRRGSGAGSRRSLSAAERAVEKQRKDEAKQRAAEEKKRKRESDKATKEAQKAAEKASRQQVKEAARTAKGLDAMQRIVPILSSKMALERVGRSFMELVEAAKKDAKERCDNVRPEPSPLHPLQCVTFKRLVPAVLSNLTESQRDNCDSTWGGEDVEEEVPYVMLYFTADEFIAECVCDGLQSVLSRLQRRWPQGISTAILVEALDSTLNKQHRQDFRQGGVDGGVSGLQTWQRVQAVVDCLLHEIPGVTLRKTTDASQSAEHIWTATRGIAKQPYMGTVTFLNAFGGGLKPAQQDSAEVRVAQAARPELNMSQLQSYLQALQCVDHLGLKDAAAIARRFPNFGALISWFSDDNRSDRERMNEVADLMQPPENNRRVGDKVATRLMKLLMATDPNIPVADLMK